MNWQLQEAKNRLNEWVKAAKTEGPQIIAARGKEEAAVASIEALRKMRRGDLPLGTYGWKTAPEVNLVIERPRDTGRDVESG